MFPCGIELFLFGAAMWYRTSNFPFPILLPNPPNILILTMSCIVQPGGLSHQMGVWYTAHHKLSLIALTKRIQEEKGLSICWAAERLMVAHSLFVNWQKQQSAEGDPILAMLKSNKKANLSGPIEQLKPLEDALLWFIIEQREQGINHICMLKNNMKCKTVAITITGLGVVFRWW